MVFKDLAPLTEAVQVLCETSYNDIKISVKLMNSSQSEFLDVVNPACCIVNDQSMHHILRYTGWSILLSSCLRKLNRQEWKDKKKEDFVKISATSCLANSTVNCILPQSRGLGLKQHGMFLTVNSLERLLIKSKLRYALPI